MKWIVLGLVGILLVIFWPRGELGEQRNPLERAQSPSAQETSRSLRSMGSARRTRGERSIRLSDEELRDKVLKLWPDITNDLSGREPAVVEIIQTRRELGKRDGPGTLSFLDDLDRKGNESAWIRARVTVAGGWAIEDPEEAALALLEKDYVLPADFQRFVSQHIVGRPPYPAQIAITQAALQVFERWAEISPDRAKEEAVKQAGEGFTSNFVITSQLVAATSSDENALVSVQVNRNSIDAILNDPNRTAPLGGAGTHQKPTKEMKSLGEPAFTQGEWAARNPQHAVTLIKEAVETGEQFYPEVVWGLAQVNANYAELLELAPAEHRMRTAIGMVNQSGNSNGELIWQLDGSETTWTMTSEERLSAASDLLENGGFTEDESAILSEILEKATIRPPYSPPPRFILHDD